MKSLPEARKFLKEHSITLWCEQAELPSLLDAMLGRVANKKERTAGRPVEACRNWRDQLLKDPELLECRLFRKFSTVIHQDLWPHATVFARLNYEKAQQSGGVISREAKKILQYLEKEGPSESVEIKKACGYSGRTFSSAKKELLDGMIVLSRKEDETQDEILDLWLRRMPKSVLTRAEHFSEYEAKLKLLDSTLQSCVLGAEKSVPKWFFWERDSVGDMLEDLVAKRDFLRVEHQKEKWIVPRKLLTMKA